MYDPRSEPNEFIGATRSEAIAKACNFYEVDEQALLIAELGPSDVSGLAARVVVVALPLDAVREAPRGNHRGHAERREPRRRGGREGPSRGNRRERTAAPAQGGEPTRERVREEGPREPSVGKAQTDLGPEGEFVRGLIERMDVGSFEISESLEDGLRALVLRGEGARRLPEADGRAVEAIQLLANQAALRIGGEDAARVVVDAEGDADRREEQLERVAERAASRAEKTGRTIGLDPMNSRDRRVVHVTLRDHTDVATMSQGSGHYRRVLVVPKGAAEYEEALESAGAAERDGE